MRTEGSVECGVFMEYFRAGGNCCVILSVMLLFVGAQALASGGDYFLSIWYLSATSIFVLLTPVLGSTWRNTVGTTPSMTES